MTRAVPGAPPGGRRGRRIAECVGATVSAIVLLVGAAALLLLVVGRA
jgi:hypothetical protein